MHSYDGHENKVGVDDLIFQNGPDKIIQILKGAYLSAAYNLEELLSYLENSQLPVRKRITSCLLAIYRLRSIEQEAVLNYIKDNFSITKETLRKELEEIKKQLKKTRMKKPKNGSCPLHSNETQEPQYKNIVKEVLCRSSIYKMGTSVLAISDVKKEIDEKNFPAYLLEQGIEIYKELESGLIYFL